MPRFVLLRHECPPDYEKPSHWDFMLEHHGVLRTWELCELPAAWARALGISETTTAEAVRAIALPDHRLAYLEYEGPLTDDRGRVRRCDTGEYQLLAQHDDLFKLELTGAVLIGRAQLDRIASEWRLVATP